MGTYIVDRELRNLLKSTIRSWLVDTFKDFKVHDHVDINCVDNQGYEVGRALIDVTFDCEFVFVSALYVGGMDDLLDCSYFKLCEPTFFNDVYDSIMKRNGSDFVDGFEEYG